MNDKSKISMKLNDRFFTKKILILVSFILIVILFLTSCSPKGPTDDEVLELAKQKFIGYSPTIIIELKIENRKSSSKISERIIFPITIKSNYIYQGLKTGWIAGGPYFEPNYDDYEYNAVIECLIAKDHFDNWKIVDSKNIQSETTKHRRPVSRSMEDFYRDRKK